MKRKRELCKRIIAIMLSITSIFASLPAEVIASAPEKAAVQSVESGQPGFLLPSGFEFYGPDDPDLETGSEETEETEETEGVEDKYPLDLLIIEPEPETVEEPEEPQEEEEEIAPEEEETDPEESDEEENLDLAGAVVSGNYTYTLSGENATITKYSGTETDVTIPGTLDGYTVVAVNGAFNGNKTVESVTFPSSVLTIGSNTFKNCSALTSVVLPDNLTTIGTYAFYQCKVLDTISLPDTVTIIDNYAFYYCEAITDLVLPESLITIGADAFYCAKGITELKIPASVTNIGASAFYGSVTKIEFADGITRIPKSSCYGASLLETVIIPSTVTSIGDHAFYQCKKLSSVTLPDAITTIESHVFYQCEAIKSVVLPDTLTTIGNYAFYQCKGLDSITLPENLKSIGNYAFAYSTLLTEIKIPVGIETIGNNAFNNSVKKIEFADGTVAIPASACYGASLLESVTIPATVTKIGDHAFYQCKKLKEISLPENVTVIDNYAFYDCAVLENVELPASLVAIGNYVFYSDKALTEIKIPVSVNSIGSSAFYNSIKKIEFADGFESIPANACNNANLLETVVMPDTVTEIGEKAFYQCKKLNDISFSANLAKIGTYAFYQCIALESVQLPTGLKTIGSNAFYACKALIAVDIPEGVTTIEKGAFYDCTAMTVARIPSTVTEMGQSVFYNSAESVIFANGTKAIPESACDGATRLKEIALPSGLISIGRRAFYGCTLLENVTIPAGVTTIGEAAFYGDTALRVRFPESLTTIEADAFTGCLLVKECGLEAEWTLDLEENVATVSGNGEIGNGESNIFAPFTDDVHFVDMQGDVTKIGDHSFEDMDQLVGIVMNDSIQEVGTEAFEDCDSLERVEFSKDLEIIDDKAFSDCDAIDTMIFTGSIPQIEETALPKQNITAYHPKTNTSYTEDTKNLYKSFLWKTWDDTLPERDVVLVLDVSGSMQGERITKLKEAVCAFADSVGGRISNTRISIVAYSDNARVLMPFSYDVTRMKASTNRMIASGGTYYLKGFSAADTELQKSDASVRSLILFSDGAPSDNRSTILSRAEEYRNNGYYIYCVGLLPTDTNRQLLINIAGDEQNYFEADEIDSLIGQFVEMSGGIGRSGKCGENVKWKYVDSKKQLIISVSNRTIPAGNMQDYNADDLPPWRAYADTLEMISVERGVTYIGTDAFAQLANVTRVQIDKSVTRIGDGAFNGCTKLQEVFYPGTEQEWKAISIGSNNDALLNAKINFETADPEQPAQDTKVVTGIRVSPANALIAVNDTLNLKAEITPKDATNKTVTWSSSDTSVATVTNTGTVKPLALGDAVITATAVDGGYTASANITVTNTIPVVKSFSFGGKTTGIKVDKNVPIIGSMESGFDLALPVELPVSCVIEDNKIKIGINVKKKSLYSRNSTEGLTTTTKQKTFKEQFEDFKKNAVKANYMARDKDWLKNVEDESFLKANIPGMEKAVNLDVVGYLEAAWSDQLETIQGSVVLTISGSATVQHQMAVPIAVFVIPVTVNCTLSASGSIIADLGYDFVNSKWYGDLELAGNVAIEPYAGIGFGQWISGGVYGKGQTDLTARVLSTRKPLGLRKWSLSGEIGLKAYFAKKSAHLTILSRTWTIFDKDSEDGSVQTDNSEAAAVPLEDQFVISTLEAAGGIQKTSTGADGTLVTDVYNAAKPTLVSADGKTLLLYVTDDTSRNLLNQTKLVYTIYDETNGTYSTAKAVLDDGTADYEPAVYTDGSDVYVVWMDSSNTYAETEDPELMDYLKTFRTHVAKYDSVTQSFTDLGSPQESWHYTYLPKLYVDEGELQLAWVESTDDTICGLSDHNTIYRSSFNEGSWTNKDKIEGLNAVTSLDIGKAAADTGVAIAYTLDQDNQLGTGVEELHVRSDASTTSKISEGSIAAVSYTKLPGVTGTVLAANVSGGLGYYKGTAYTELLPEGTMNADSPFAASDDHVIYLLSGDENRNIGIACYDNGSWGTTLLTHESDYVDTFSFVNGKLSYLNSKAVCGKDGIWDVTSSIKVLQVLDYNDTELELVDYAMADLYAGATLPVDLYIRNNGITKVTKVHASVTYGGTEISSADIDVDLMPGETKPYEHSFTIPTTLSSGGDFIVTVTSDDDSVEENNRQTVSLMKADLEVRSSYDAEGTTPYIIVEVENRGLMDSNMVLTATDEDGKILFTKEAPVKGGEIVTYKEAYTGEKTQTLTVTVSGDAEEVYEMNNVSWLQVGGKSSPDKDFTVGFEDITADPYDGLCFNADENRFETVFTGSAIKPAVVVTGNKGVLKEGIDYTVSYSNNIKCNSNQKTSAKVTVKGKGNYAGTKVLDFYILPADLALAQEKGLLTIEESFRVQNGKKLKPLICYRGYRLKSSDMILSNKGAIKADTSIDISGKGNFSGTLKNLNVICVSSEDVKNNEIKVKLKAEKHIYNREKQLLSETELTVTTASGATLKEGVDYDTVYYNNEDAGTAGICIRGKGTYFGTAIKSFKILPDKSSDITATLSDPEAKIYYDPQGAKPAVSVTASGTRLIEGKDYRLVYSNNKKIGTGSYAVKFLGNYKGHAAIKPQDYTIEAATFAGAEAIAQDMIYKKAGKYISKPYVSVDGVLLKAKDYTVEYYDGETQIKTTDKISLKDDESYKTITVKITGKGNYQEEVIEISYNVIRSDAEKIDLSRAKIVSRDKVSGKDVPVGKQQYTGREIEPEIRVLVKNGKNWTEVPATAYTVSYINNVHKGKASIYVTGNGTDAVGSRSVGFSITSKNLNNFAISTR